MIYLNEWDDFPAAGLAAMYPHATVDTTSIVLLNRTDYGPHPAGVPVDVDLSQYTQCHFFAGIGGWQAALALAGWPDDRPIWTMSCPCQPFSNAGKRLGTDAERHLWPDAYRQIQRFRPPEVFGEQVASKDGLEWLAGVQSDLEAAGYFVWCVDLAAASVGSPIIRQRLFWGARRRDLSRPASCGLGRRTGASGARDDGSEAADDCESLHSPIGERCDVPRCDRRAMHHVGPGEAQQLSGGKFCGPCYWAIVDAVGGASLTGSQRHLGHGDDRHEPGRLDTDTSRSTATSGVCGPDELGESDVAGSSELQGVRRRMGETARPSGGCDHWSNYAIAWFRDDKRPGQFKARRIEPGIVPVAYGIPTKHADILPRLSQLGLDAECPKRCIALAKRHRVGTIRGYGNAIVPEVAAQFLRVWLEEFPT